jgi:hypothetical protein
MNLTSRYLEQKGIEPRRDYHKPIQWSNLINVTLSMNINGLPYYPSEYKTYIDNYIKEVNIILEFDLTNAKDPINDFQGILEPNHDQLDFIYDRNHITLKDVNLIRYDFNNQIDYNSKLIVELMAKDIIIKSSVMGGI